MKDKKLCGDMKDDKKKIKMRAASAIWSEC